MYAWVDLCGVKVINSAAISTRVLRSRTHVGDYIRSTSATHSSQVREVTELVTPGDGKFQWQGGYGRARPGADKIPISQGGLRAGKLQDARLGGTNDDETATTPYWPTSLRRSTLHVCPPAPVSRFLGEPYWNRDDIRAYQSRACNYLQFPASSNRRYHSRDEWASQADSNPSKASQGQG